MIVLLCIDLRDVHCEIESAPCIYESGFAPRAAGNLTLDDLSEAQAALIQKRPGICTIESAHSNTRYLDWIYQPTIHRDDRGVVWFQALPMRRAPASSASMERQIPITMRIAVRGICFTKPLYFLRWHMPPEHTELSAD